MIKEAYCSFEVAKLLKEKGFNWRTQYVYTLDGTGSTPTKIGNWRAKSNIRKPTHQMAMKWLREVHNINIDIVSIWNLKQWEYQIFVITPTTSKSPYVDNTLYMTYENAIEVALKYCLENLI